MWHTVGRERRERLVRRRGCTCARSRRGLSVVKVKQIHNWCRHGLWCLACDFGLRRRRTALAGRIRGVRAAGRSLVIASIVLFKVGSSRWRIPESTAAPTARVFFYSGISDDLKKKRAISHTSIVPACVGSIITTITATTHCIIPEPSIAPATTARKPIVTGADIFGSVGLGLFTFLSDFFHVGE